MEIITKSTERLTDGDIDEVSRLAGIGFGQGDTPQMRQDTLEHFKLADYVQLGTLNGELVGFSMYRRFFWRTCD